MGRDLLFDRRPVRLDVRHYRGPDLSADRRDPAVHRRGSGALYGAGWHEGVTAVAVLNWLRQIFAIVARVERLEKKLEDEIKQIKAEVEAYRDGVNAKIAELEAAIAANGGGNAAVQAALDDLKATADALSVPA